MSRKELKARAKQSLSGNWGTAIGAMILTGIIAYALTFLFSLCVTVMVPHQTTYSINGAVTTQQTGTFNPIMIIPSVILFVALVILLSALSVGNTLLYQKIVGNFENSVGDIFVPLKSYPGKCVGTNVLLGIFTFLWSLLFYIPGIIKSFSYSQTLYNLNDDPNMRAVDTITLSKNMMRGHKWEMFVLYLSFFGWFLLLIPTFGLISFYLFPYMNATMAEYHNYIQADSASMEYN